MQVHLLVSNVFGRKPNTKSAVLLTSISMSIIWSNHIKKFVRNAENTVLRSKDPKIINHKISLRPRHK